jgi:hypothetical protein
MVGYQEDEMIQQMMYAYEQQFVQQNIDPATQQDLLQDYYHRILQQKYANYHNASNMLQK